MIFDAFISVKQTCVVFGSAPVQVQQFSADSVKTGSGLTLIHVGSYNIFKQKGLCAEGRKLQVRPETLLHSPVSRSACGPS